MWFCARSVTRAGDLKVQGQIRVKTLKYDPFFKNVPHLHFDICYQIIVAHVCTAICAPKTINSDLFQEKRATEPQKITVL